MGGYVSLLMAILFVRRRYSFIIGEHEDAFWEKLKMASAQVRKLPYSGLWKEKREFIAHICSDKFEVKVNSPKRDAVPIPFLPGSVKFVGKRVEIEGVTKIVGSFRETSGRIYILVFVYLFIPASSILKPEAWGWTSNMPFDPVFLAFVNLLLAYFIFTIGGWISLWVSERTHINRLKSLLRKCSDNSKVSGDRALSD